MPEGTRPIRILLRSSWQTVNIGDVSHTPGMLAAIGRAIPHARVTLWPCDLSLSVRQMLSGRFPDLQIIEGTRDDLTDPTSALCRAFEAADLLLHGSGPSVVTPEDLAAWSQRTCRPYGMMGITLDPIPDRVVPILNSAAFLFCRDTISMNRARQAGLRVPTIGFGPDAAFSCDLSNEQAACDLLARVGLANKPFVVVIPRMRYTPYHEIHGYEPSEHERGRAAVSQRHLASDMQLMADAIISLTTEDDVDVLIAPEMSYQVEMAARHLIPRIPERCRHRIHMVDFYWSLDVACSVYRRASLLVSMEMHSPILAVAQCTPAILVRQPTDTCKGQMWRDVGLSQWSFEIDSVKADELVSTTRQILANPAEAKRLVTLASRSARRQQDRCLRHIEAWAAAGRASQERSACRLASAAV